MKKMLFILCLLMMSAQGGKELLKQEILTSETPQNTLSKLQVEAQQPQTQDPQESMNAPILSLVMAMVERDMDYAPEDADCIWTALYYYVGMHQNSDFRVLDLGDQLEIPKEMIQDTAFALFGHCEIPPVPLSLEANVQQQGDSYLFAKGDAAYCSCDFTKVEDLGEGKVLLQGNFIDLARNLTICGFEAVVVESDSMFGYHLLSVETLRPQLLAG